MSLARFLADTVSIESPQAGRNSSGEKSVAHYQIRASGLVCRIISQQLPGDVMAGTAAGMAVADYVAIFPMNSPALPAANDRLLRTDGDRFLVVGEPDLQGLAGKNMGHYRVPVRRIGVGV